MKTNILLLLSTILFFSCSSRAKQTSIEVSAKKEINYIPYYLNVYEADSLFYAKNFEKTFNLLDELFTEFEPINVIGYDEYLLYTKVSILLGKKMNYKNVYSNLILNFGYTSEYLKKDSLLNIGLLKSQIDSNEYKILRKTYLSKIDFELRDEIIEMVKFDQKFRKETIENKGLIDSLDGIELAKIDLINKDKLFKILNKEFPNRNKIGKSDAYGKSEYESTKIFSIINHLAHNDDSYKYLSERLHYFIELGECNPYNLAALNDSKYTQFIDYKDIYIGDSLNMKYKNIISNLYFYRRFDVLSKLNSKLKEKTNKNRMIIGLPSVEQELFWRSKYN